MEKEPLVSACLIVRDEASNLPRCLKSLVGLADEVIVVDTGSMDGTPTLAQDLGAKVFHEPWQDDFAKHRNTAISHARGVWILTIDADEELFETDIEVTRFHLQSEALPPILTVEEVIGYPGGGRRTFLLPRLFRRSEGFRYVYPVHEQLDAAGRSGGMSNVRLRHYGYDSPEVLQRKEERNLALALSMADSPHAHHCRARAASSLRRWDVVMQAARGLVECPMAPIMASEACALAVVAAIRVGDLESARWFAEKVRERVPQSPELGLLDLMIAAAIYLDGDAARWCMAGGDSTEQWSPSRRAVAAAREMLDTLLGLGGPIE